MLSIALFVGSIIGTFVLFMLYNYYKSIQRTPDDDGRSKNQYTDAKDFEEHREQKKKQAVKDLELRTMEQDLKDLDVQFNKNVDIRGVPVLFEIEDTNLLIVETPAQAKALRETTDEYTVRILNGPDVKTEHFTHALYDFSEVSESEVDTEDIVENLSEDEKAAFKTLDIPYSTVNEYSESELQQLVRDKMKEVHPDTVNEKEWSNKEFQDRKQAYDYLKDTYF